MTSTLTFNLPEDSAEHHAAIHGMAYRLALSEIREQIRQKLKYGHHFQSPEVALEWAHKMVIDVCQDALNPDEVP